MRVEVKLTRQGARTLAALRNAGGWMGPVMAEVTLLAARRIERQAKRRAPVRTGGGRRSIGVVSPLGGGSDHEIVSDLHMLVMDEGRKPRSTMPPVEPLELWGRRVLRQRGLGFVLARSIARKGIRPRRFFHAAIHRVTVVEKSRLDRDIGRLIRRALREATGGGR